MNFDFKFLVNLIVVNQKQTNYAKKSIKGNCVHICKNVYTMEGDINCLLDDDVDFNFIDEGIVNGLGEFSEKKLVKICEEVFGVDVYKLKYNKNKKYKEN